MNDASAQHVSVMLDRCIELLSPTVLLNEKPVIVDCTLGLGGHTEALLEKFPTLTVIGIDRDQIALERASARLAHFGTRFKSAHAVFDQISEVVAENGFNKVNGILFDLGVSSIQLDEGWTYPAPDTVMYRFLEVVCEMADETPEQRAKSIKNLLEVLILLVIV